MICGKCLERLGLLEEERQYWAELVGEDKGKGCYH